MQAGKERSSKRRSTSEQVAAAESFLDNLNAKHSPTSNKAGAVEASQTLYSQVSSTCRVHKFFKSDFPDLRSAEMVVLVLGMRTCHLEHWSSCLLSTPHVFTSDVVYTSLCPMWIMFYQTFRFTC